MHALCHDINESLHDQMMIHAVSYKSYFLHTPIISEINTKL